MQAGKRLSAQLSAFLSEGLCSYVPTVRPRHEHVYMETIAL